MKDSSSLSPILKALPTRTNLIPFFFQRHVYNVPSLTAKRDAASRIVSNLLLCMVDSPVLIIGPKRFKKNEIQAQNRANK